MSKLFFWAMNLLVFLLPTYLFRFKIAGLSTNFFEICFLFIFIWWVIEKRYKKREGLKDNFMLTFRQFINQNRLLSYGISLLLMGISLSTVFSPNQLTSLGIVKSWFIIPIALVWMIINTFPENLKLKTQNSKFTFSRQDFESSVKVPRRDVGGSSIASSSIPNFFYHPVSLLKSLAFSGLIVTFISLGYLFNNNLTYDGRLKAFFEHPNHLAMYLAPCLLIIVGHLLSRIESQKNKIFWFVSLFIISIPLYFTYSYGAWMGIVIGGVTLLWGYRRIKTRPESRKAISRKALMILMVFIVIFAFVILTQANSPKFQNIFITQRSSLHSRLMIWRSASYILKNNWLLGIGPGMFQKHYLNYQKYFSPYLEWAVPQPHNIFLAFWLQTGIIGFTGFILILIRFFRAGLKAIHKISKNKKEALTALILMAIMIYTLIHGLVDTLYWKNDLAVTFWVVIALMSIICHQDYLQRKESPPCQK